MSSYQILQGDCLEQLKIVPDESVQMCCTSPPYWGLRDYGTAKWEGGSADCDHSPISSRKESSASTLVGSNPNGNHAKEGFKGGVCLKCGAIRVDNQLGLEKTPEEYVAKMVAVFREVKRVLRDDGTLFLNIGDTYSAHKDCKSIPDSLRVGGRSESANVIEKGLSDSRNSKMLKQQGYKNKDLVGIPWLVAKALQSPYYTGRIKDEKDRVWLAAMIDAEGCMTMSQYETGGKNKSNIYISITNSVEKLLIIASVFFHKK
jgi:site-specific DNA-methyltransferase (cytosine-N4-specific)